MQVNATTPLPRVEVSATGPDLTSRAGTALLSALADRLGLTGGLTAALRCHSRKVRHEPGRVVRDLAVMLADGGDCNSTGRIVRHARSLRLRLPRSWPWAPALASAFVRLQALPSG